MSTLFFRYNSTDNHPSIIRTLFGMELENRFKCRCGEVQSRNMVSTIVDLQYPDVLHGEFVLALLIVTQLGFAQLRSTKL